MNKKPTALERITGNPIIEGGATLIAGLGAATTPFSALLPVLTSSLAGRRQQERVEATLKEISLILEKHEETLQHISDEQYHLLTESIAATFQTIDARKLAYLQSAIRNCLSIEGLVKQEAALLARIIWDISAEEADFIAKYFSYKYIHVTDITSEVEANEFKIPRGSHDSLIVAGLEVLGVLEFGVATLGAGNKLCFSSITAKLLLLLNPPHRGD